MTVYPVAFSVSNEVWGSDGMFYGAVDWWNMDNGRGLEKTNMTTLSYQATYMVMGVVNNYNNQYCFVREKDRILYTPKGCTVWDETSWSEERIIKEAIFIPGNLLGCQEATTEPSEITKPNPNMKWIQMSDSTCYFCNTHNCDHIKKLKL